MARILVADDMELSRLSISAVLEGFGHHVTEAEDGRDCLERLKAEGTDLLVTDMDMPNMSGNELIEKLGEIDPYLPVIAISGHDDLGGIRPLDEARRLGAWTVLRKPFGAGELVSAIDSMLKQASASGAPLSAAG